MKNKTLVLLACAVIVSISCHSSGQEPPEPNIQSSMITVDQLPTELDQTPTYHYQANPVDKPEDLIRTLWNAGIRTRFAWYPLDNLCLNPGPEGPRFTVELARETARIVDFGFERGVGYLYCATTLIAYDVTAGG